MSKINIGFCGIDEVFIGGKNNPKYTEFSMMLSDGTHARHGICKNCIVKLTDTIVAKLFLRIQDSWSDQMVGWATKNQFNRMRALTVKAWDINETTAVSKYKIVKENDRQAVLKVSKKQYAIK